MPTFSSSSLYVIAAAHFQLSASPVFIDALANYLLSHFPVSACSASLAFHSILHPLNDSTLIPIHSPLFPFLLCLQQVEWHPQQPLSPSDASPEAAGIFDSGVLWSVLLRCQGSVTECCSNLSRLRPTNITLTLSSSVFPSPAHLLHLICIFPTKGSRTQSSCRRGNGHDSARTDSPYVCVCMCVCVSPMLSCLLGRYGSSCLQRDLPLPIFSMQGLIEMNERRGGAPYQVI